MSICLKRKIEINTFKVVPYESGTRLEFNGVAKISICQHMYLSRAEASGWGLDIGTVVRQPVGIDYGVEGASENHPIPAGT